VALPAFNEDGDLPPGVHGATLSEVLARFGQGSVQRCAVADRLTRLYQLAASTRQVTRFVVFGSFVTAKAEPNDIDIILLMKDTFDLAAVTGEAALMFHHLEAHVHFGASVFWSNGRRAGDDRILAGAPPRRPTRDCGDPAGGNMIENDQQLQTTLERIAWFQNQVAHLRQTETNPVNYRGAVSGFLAEIDRMQLEVREYFSFLPTERVRAA
jgi:predicted nucleotidyltransferase